MITLILDTSTERGIAALLKGDTLLFHSELPFGLQNSQHLLPELEKGMKSAGITWKGLNLIGVGVGPGSYTGIRVGAATAKMLSFANQIPLVGLCTLNGFIPNEDGGYAVVIDAKIGGVYLQKAKRQEGKITYLTDPEVYSLAEAVSILQDIPLLITPNALQLRAKFEALSPKSWCWCECYPSPQQFGLIAQNHFHYRHYSLDGRLDLLYMRKTQAELEKEIK